MYVNGQSTLCNDFTTPTTTLNIADAAVGFTNGVYHSSGEFVERLRQTRIAAQPTTTATTPGLDQRTWDNMGFEENVLGAQVRDFNPAICFEHTSLGPENNEP